MSDLKEVGIDKNRINEICSKAIDAIHDSVKPEPNTIEVAVALCTIVKSYEKMTGINVMSITDYV